MSDTCFQRLFKGNYSRLKSSFYLNIDAQIGGNKSFFEMECHLSW